MSNPVTFLYDMNNYNIQLVYSNNVASLNQNKTWKNWIIKAQNKIYNMRFHFRGQYKQLRPLVRSAPMKILTSENFDKSHIILFCSMLPLYHIPKVFYWIQIRWLGRPNKNIELSVMFMKPLIDWYQRAKVCQENIPQTITPPPTTPTSLNYWYRLGPWIHAVGAKFRPYHLYFSVEIEIHQTRLNFSSLQLSSFGEPVPTAASAFCSWLTEVEPNVVFCCCSPSASRFDVLYILRCFSAHHNCTEWLSELTQPFCQPEAVWPFSVELSSARHFGPQNCHSLHVFFFFRTSNSRDCCAWRS